MALLGRDLWNPGVSMSRIEQNRRQLDTRPRVRRWASPAILGLEAALGLELTKASGRVLDVGCGAMPYRSQILAVADSYDGLDIEKRHEDVRYLASATDMSVVPDDSYDTVLCSEVLEHVSDPDRALSEIARVLRGNGHAIISVPFLARLHEEPEDYQRLTEHGLRVLCDRAGLKVDELQVTGSLGSFLGHLGATWHVPVVKWIFYALNLVLVVGPSRGFDRLMGPLRRKLPLGYVLVVSPTLRNPLRADPPT